MANEQLTCVLRHVRKLIGLERSTELTDGQLLDAFVVRRDEAAFTTLVQRHGPMVQRVCRRVLGDAHDAEDAFQAAFLVLARKAGAIRHRSSVGGWLYEVAYHLALRGRANAARRRKHERQAPEMSPPNPLSEREREELQTMLDEELHRLPEKYRTPLVLCYLEGKTNTQAAEELGWPAGSMSSRLTRARELLRDRLAGRGVALSAGGLALLLAESVASGAVSAVLVENTVQAAVWFAAGKTTAAGMVSAKAVVLAEGMLSAMMTTKMKIAAALLLAIGLLGTGTTAWLRQSVGAETPVAEAGQQQAEEFIAADAPPAQEKAAKSDLYGDPLPPGALARLGTIRWRHGAAVSFVGYAQSGKQLVTASADGFFRVWEVESGKELRKFAMPNAGLQGQRTTGMIAVGGAAMTWAPQMVSGSAALSPDGTVLASATADGIIRLYDVNEGKELRQIKTTAQGVAITFTPDGKSLVTRGNDQVFRQWEVATAKEMRQFGKPADSNKQRFGFGAAVTPVISPNGKLLAMGGMELDGQMWASTLTLWDFESGKQVHQIKQQQNGVGSVVFSSDSKSIAWPSPEGIRLYDVTSAKEIRTLDKLPENVGVSALVMSPDGKLLAVQATDQAIRLYDPATGKEVRQLGETGTGQGKGLRVAINGFGYGGAAPQAIAFAPDGKTLAQGTSNNTVRLWDVQTGKENVKIGGHRGSVASIHVSSDGKTLTTWGADNTLRQWEAMTGKERGQVKLPEGATLAVFSPDGKSLVFPMSDNTLRLWDVAAGKELRQITLPAHQMAQFGMHGITGLVFSPDGKVLASKGPEPVIRLWDVESGKELRQLGEAGAVGALAPGVAISSAGAIGGSTRMVFSPDGTHLAVLGASANPRAGVNPQGGVRVGGNSVVRFWNVATAKEVGRIDVPKPAFALAYSPDGRNLVTANSDNTMTLWEVATATERGQYKGSGTVVAFSADGRTLAASGPDSKLRLWDVRTTKELGQFEGHQGAITALAFAPDGKRVISGSADTSALVWDAAGLPREARQPADLEAKQVEGLWTDLIGADGRKAFQAINTLATAARQAVPFLKAQLKPVPGVEAKKLEQLVAGLDSEEFAVRQKSADELEKLGELAELALKKLLEGKPALETRQRADNLMEKLITSMKPTKDTLQALRAVEALEEIGTPEAKQALETIAKGAPGARLTRAAQGALERLGK